MRKALTGSALIFGDMNCDKGFHVIDVSNSEPRNNADFISWQKTPFEKVLPLRYHKTKAGHLSCLQTDGSFKIKRA